MVEPISFTKMHGLGNDFVIIDGLLQPHFVVSATWVKAMADRHRGVGFDQLLWLLPADQPRIDYRVRIFNADGHEVGQCGNGLRCVGQYLFDHHHPNESSLQLVTACVKAQVIRLGSQVAVWLDEPAFDPAVIPCDISRLVVESWPGVCRIDDPLVSMTFGMVSLGNPHAVMWVDRLAAVDIEAVALRLQGHPAFPQQVNVGFVQQQSPQELDLIVYERVMGQTQACGSGACAAAIIGQINNRLGEAVIINQPGGVLRINWPKGCGRLQMIGETTTVYCGQYFIKD